MSVYPCTGIISIRSKRALESIRRIRRRDEKNIRAVKRNIQVVIEKLGILLGVQELQQRRGRISTGCPARRNLIDLVDQKDGVLAPNPFHSLNEFPGMAPT